MSENENFHASAYTALGTARTEKVQLPEATFDGIVNQPVMHQAVKAFMANQRQGNASTKIRKFVTGGNQKPWKQKGTGRARQGSTRAPQWVGGGTVFGPTPRPYDEYVPRQVRALAKRSALSARAREEAVIVIDAFNYEAPKTSLITDLLARLDLADKKVLILTDGVKHNVFLSGRNLPNVHVLPFTDSSTYHILWSDVVLIEGGAIGQTLAPLANEKPAPIVKRARSAADIERGARRAAKRAAKSEAKAGAAGAAGAEAAPVKAAAKKAPAKKAPAKKAAAKKSTKKEK